MMITLLTLPSKSPRSDAMFLQDLFVRHVSQLIGPVTLEQYAANGRLTNDDDVIAEGGPVTTHPQEEDEPSGESIAAATTIYMAQMNVLILLISSAERLVTLSDDTSTNEHFSTTAGKQTSNIVPWIVSENLILELYSSNTPHLRNNTAAPKELPIRLPSGSSVLLLIAHPVDLSTPEPRVDMVQNLLSCILGQRNLNLTTEEKIETLVDISLTDTKSATTTTGIVTQNDGIPRGLPLPSLPKFPSLDAKILMETTSSSTGVLQPLPLNSQEPINFETRLFRGKLLLILKPPQNPSIEDPFWDERIFSKRKRRLIIQVQGQFKSMPQGTVYAGAEISQPMKLGLVTRSVCTLLLTLVERFNTNIHSSFGTMAAPENADNLLQEFPHIVAPAYTFFERLVVTPPHEEPPSLCDEIDESPESLNQRRKSNSLGTWNTTDTYTFSFYSMYIDLPTWQLVGLPASGDIGLQTFWGQSLLRICIYDKTDSNEKKHVPRNNRYVFSVELQYLGRNGSLQREVEKSMLPFTANGDDELDKEDSRRGNIFKTDRRLRQTIQQQLPEDYSKYLASPIDRRSESQVLTSLSTPINRSESQLFTNFPESSSYEDSVDGENDDEDNVPFFDAKESHSALSEDRSEWITPKARPAGSPMVPSPLSLTNSMKLLLAVDSFCPYWMDLCTASRNGGSIQYIKIYACRLDFHATSVSFRSENACFDFLNYKSKSNSPSIMDMVSDVLKDHFSPRLSSSEKLRRCLGLALSDTYGVNELYSNHLATFRNMDDNTLQLFGTKLKPSVGPNVRLSAFLMRASCDRHWVEEWACLYERHMTLRHLERRKGSELVIILSNVLHVLPLPPERYPPFALHPILAISTLARTVYLMFSSESDMEQWRQMIDTSIQTTNIHEDVESNTSNDSQRRLPETYSAADDFVHRSSMWNCKNRRILNSSQLYFRPHYDPTALNYIHPSIIVETALQKVVKLSKEGLENTSDLRIREFFVCAADLKQISVSGLDEVTRLAMYLNLYHLMISHAYLVLGPPDSSLKWINYFNNIAYAIGDDIFSLTELEHSIIRANMSYPTQFFSRFVIPKSAYPLLALQISDYRINFALNCGSLSNPSKVILYKPDRLNEQLDAACRLYLYNAVSYRRTLSGDLQLLLPRICQWFCDDFGKSRSDLLIALEPFLAPDVQDQLSGRRLPSKRFDMSSIVIRFLPYNFDCRPLSLV